MDRAIFNKNFIFVLNSFRKYHYTDNLKGAPSNYLAYMLKGHAKIVSAKKTIHINAGDVFFIPVHLPYESYWYGNDEISWLSFGFSDLFTHETDDIAMQVVHCDKTLKNKIANIPCGDVTCRTLSLFYDIFADILPEMERSFPGNEAFLVQVATKYINEHLNCSVADIARECLISEAYVYVIFKNVLGCTPNEYRRRQLIKKGAELLIHTDKKIEEISDMLNFSSCSYFRKLMKKYLNATPREIRKKYSGKNRP